MEIKKTSDYFLNIEDIARFKRKGVAGLVWGIIFIVVGVPLLFLYGLGFVFILCGIAFLITGSNYRRRGKAQVLRGDEYDSLVYELVNQKGGNILQKLGLDTSEVQLIKPICFICFNFLESQKCKVGEDGVPRSNIIDKTVMFFTENEMHFYKISCNSINNEIRETTKIWFYKDIMSIEINNGNKIFDRETVCYLEVKISLANGKEETIILSGEKADEYKESVNAMRYLIKEHRE